MEEENIFLSRNSSLDIDDGDPSVISPTQSLDESDSGERTGFLEVEKRLRAKKVDGIWKRLWSSTPPVKKVFLSTVLMIFGVFLFLVVHFSVVHDNLDNKVDISPSLEEIVVLNKLYGTFMQANKLNGVKKAAMIIAGSGPTDRDGNSKISGFSPNTYLFMAQDLAIAGISSLRYDKRGIGESVHALSSEYDLRFKNFTDDALAWSKLLRHKANVTCVWVIGHSEGATIAEVIAQNNSDICGIILVASAGRKASEILREQLATTLKADPLLENSLSELELGHAVDPAGLPASLFRASVQPYLISWFAVDPEKLMASITTKVLILQGTTDIQVSVQKDAKSLYNASLARHTADLVILDNINHVLKYCPSLTLAAQLATYANSTLPLGPGVSEAVSAFILDSPSSE